MKISNDPILSKYYQMNIIITIIVVITTNIKVRIYNKNQNDIGSSNDDDKNNNTVVIVTILIINRKVKLEFNEIVTKKIHFS